MISRCNSSIPKEDVVFPRVLYCHSRGLQTWPRCSLPHRWCSHTCRWHSQTCRWRSQTCCWRSQTCHQCPQTWSQRSQACCWHSQTLCRRSQTRRLHSQACHQRSWTCRQCSEVLRGAPKVLSGALRCSQTYYNHFKGTPEPMIRYPNNSKGQPECPPMVGYSPEIDASKFTLHILSDSPGGSQWLK